MNINNNNYIKVLLILITIVAFLYEIYSAPIEDLLIVNAIGCDVEKGPGDDNQFSISTSYYTFQNNKLYSYDVKTSKGFTIGQIRENRFNKVSKDFRLGFEKVYLFSENLSENEFKLLLDSLFTNSSVNDNGSIAVVQGSAENALKKNITSEVCAADEIDGIITNLKTNSFYTKHYTIMDAYLQTNNEGKSLVMPFIGSSEGGFQVKGLALFKNFKLIGKLNDNETKYFNLLRENNVKGHLDIQRGTKESLSLYGISKRKVKCEKYGNEYKFLIEISFTGDLQGNNIYGNLYTDASIKKEVEDEIAKEAEINSKMIIDKLRNQYHFDGLDLGSIAASKYGRQLGGNWHEIISNSEINVKVKVHLERTGRGSLAS